MLLALVILCIYLFRNTAVQQESSDLGRSFLTFSLLRILCMPKYCYVHSFFSSSLWYFRSTSAYITVVAFLLGALCSGIAGYVGMWVSVRANVRVSSAARRSAREALQVLSKSCVLPCTMPSHSSYPFY